MMLFVETMINTVRLSSCTKLSDIHFWQALFSFDNAIRVQAGVISE